MLFLIIGVLVQGLIIYATYMICSIETRKVNKYNDELTLLLHQRNEKIKEKNLIIKNLKEALNDEDRKR